MKITEVDWGVANNFGDEIEVNRHLKEYPKLYIPIMRHEFAHDNSVFSWKELKHDLVTDNKLNQWDLLKFMIHHPKTFTQLSPIYYSKKRGFVIDLNLSLIFFVMTSLIIGSFFIFLRIF